MILMCLLSFVARLKESRRLQYDMGGPLLQFLGEECVGKTFSAFIVAGGAVVSFPWRRPATRNVSRHQSRNFDPTKGYRVPGRGYSDQLCFCGCSSFLLSLKFLFLFLIFACSTLFLFSILFLYFLLDLAPACANLSQTNYTNEPLPKGSSEQA